jgi:hypothetical protein
VEGYYNGALVPGRHYIELKRDFSNLESVLGQMADEKLRTKIVENAYCEVVASGKYHYERFVKQVLEISLGNKSERKRDHWLTWRYAQAANLFGWIKIASRRKIFFPLYRRVIAVLPHQIGSAFEALMKRIVYK